MHLKNYPIIIALSFLVIATGCVNKNSEIDYNPNVKSSKDYIFAEDVYIEVFNTYFKSVNDPEVLAGESGWIDNATVVYNDTENRMYFQYGEVNRGCPDGKFRRGYYQADFNGPVNQEGTRATLSFHEFFVNDDKVTGTAASEFLGSGTGDPGYSYTVTGGVIELFDTVEVRQIAYNCDYEIFWEQGLQTPGDHDDDLLSITGTSDGVSVDNYDFSAMVTVPLRNNLGCYYIQSGILEISIPSGSVEKGTIDYIIEDDCNSLVNFYFDDNLFFDRLWP